MNINEQSLEFQKGYYEGKIAGLKEAKGIFTGFTEQEKQEIALDHVMGEVQEQERADREEEYAE